MTDTTVVIPVYRNTRGVEHLLSHISFSPAHVLIAVDDHPAGQRYHRLEEVFEFAARTHFPRNFNLLYTGHNSGFASAVNRAFSEIAPHHRIVLLNSDVELSAEQWVFLMGLTSVLDSQSFLGTLPEKLQNDLFPSITHSTGPEAPTEVFGLALDFPFPSFEIALFGSNPAAAGLLLDADLFRQGYGEDTEWCIRASEAGWKVESFLWPRPYRQSQTFGYKKAAIKKRSLKVIQSVYPDFITELERAESSVRTKFEKFTQTDQTPKRAN